MSTTPAPNAEHQAQAGDIVLHLQPPLACVRVKNNNDLCGNPAHVANAVLVDGRYIVRPWCYQCTSEIAAVYGLIEPQRNQEGAERSHSA